MLSCWSPSETKSPEASRLSFALPTSMKYLKEHRVRYLLPNAITFLSLACGVAAIALAGSGALMEAGLLVLASYVLDLLDGEAARRLNAGSAFGVQLDSLVDMVSLGVAPAMLAFFHLRMEGDVTPFLLWPATIFYVTAGAFRLARFNLLPEKTGQTDSIGLTISTAGATLTLAVLSDIVNVEEVLANALFIPLLLSLALLMVSRLKCPSIVWLFSRWWANLLYMIYFVITLVILQLSLFHVWFLFNSGYLGIAVMRAGFRVFND